MCHTSGQIKHILTLDEICDLIGYLFRNLCGIWRVVAMIPSRNQNLERKSIPIYWDVQVEACMAGSVTQLATSLRMIDF